MITIINNQSDSKLGDLVPGEKAEIVGFDQVATENENFLRRLSEVGFLTGSTVEVIGQAPYSQDPISIRVKEATYALRRAEANFIRVKKIKNGQN